MISFRFGSGICVICLSSASLFGQTQQKLNIDQATVFLRGAELTSSTHIDLAKGENEILFTNVAGDVNSQSLTVNATNGVVVESAAFQNNFLADEIFSPRAKQIKDSIELMAESIAIIKNKIAVLDEEIAVLKGNRKVGGDNTGLSVAELTKMLDLINSRMEGYLTQKNKLQTLLNKENERWAKLKKQLTEEQKKAYQPGGQLLVKFYSKEATNSAIVIDYIVPNAGWIPTYDIMADDISSPVRLFYKANIWQNSGVKWSNVHLSLSTGNPQEGAEAPVLNPWYLSFYVSPIMQPLESRASVKYKTMRGEQLNIGGARTDGDATSIGDYVSIDNAGINTTFNIDLPYTIPSDGQQHFVAIKNYNVPATYRYFAVPKLDQDVFLQAQFTNWEDLNLLPGSTNVFYEGTYVGQGYLDVHNVKDTMTISMGRDKKIVVKRERDSKLRSVKAIGTNVRETFVYNITVRNTRKESINLTLQDQMPVSNDKDIVLEDIDAANSEYDNTTGTMKWALTLAPNETRIISFGYTVKYPKGKIISNLK